MKLAVRPLHGNKPKELLMVKIAPVAEIKNNSNVGVLYLTLRHIKTKGACYGKPFSYVDAASLSLGLVKNRGEFLPPVIGGQLRLSMLLIAHEN